MGCVNILSEMDLAAVLAALYESELNWSISCISDS